MYYDINGVVGCRTTDLILFEEKMLKKNKLITPPPVVYDKLFVGVMCAIAAQASSAEILDNGEHVFDEDVRIGIELNRGGILGAVYADSVEGTKIVLSGGSTMYISGDAGAGDNPDKSVIAVEVENSSKLLFDGNLNIDVAGSQKNVRSFWINGSATFNGNVHAVNVANGTSNLSESIKLEKGDLTFNGSETYLRSETQGGRVLGVENWSTNGGVINFNSEKTVIEAVINDPSAANLVQGYLGYQSTVNFNGNTYVDVAGAKSTVYGIDIQCDPGNVYETVANFNGDETKISASGASYVYGLRPSGVPAKLNLNGKSVSIDVESTEGLANGIRSIYGAHVVSKADLNVNATGVDAYGVYAGEYSGYSGSIFQQGNMTIQVSAENEGRGIFSSTEGATKVGSEEDGSVVVEGSTVINVQAGIAVGVASEGENALSSLNGGSIITVVGGSEAYGAKAQTDASIKLADADLKASLKDPESGVAYGLYLDGESSAVFSGVNSVEGATNGIFVSDSASSVSLDRNASVSANNVQNNGTIKMGSGSRLEAAEGSNLGSINFDYAGVDAPVDAVVAVGSGTYTVASVSGGSHVFMATDIAGLEKLTILDDQSAGATTIAAAGSANDQYSSAAEAADELKNKIEGIGYEEGDKLIVEAGAVNDSFSSTFEDGKWGEGVYEKNPFMEFLGSTSVLSANQFRDELSRSVKRLDEVRLGGGELGGWARIYGSEYGWGSPSIDLKSASVEAGFDSAVNEAWTAGASFSYSKGDLDSMNGSGSRDAYSITGYGSWNQGEGRHLDLSVKFSRIDSDYASGGVATDASNNAAGAALQYGWTIPFAQRGFVEPQAGLSYGRIFGDDYTASNGVKVSEDDVDVLVGRLGVKAGYAFAQDAGSIYASAAVLHDFMGDVEGRATHDKSSNVYSESLGGTWVEYGMGASFAFSPNVRTFVELERSTGGEVKENWSWNAGVRCVF